MIEAVQAVQPLAFTTPLRRNQVVRDAVWRLEGRARPGAELEVEVNGRLVVSDSAAFDGRFVLFIPLERGLNRVFVESFEIGSLHGERSPVLMVRRATGGE